MKNLIGKRGIILFLSAAGEFVKDKAKTKFLLQRVNKKATMNKTSIQSVWHQLELLIEAVKAWRSGEYKQISTKSILIIIAGLLYFVTPIDMVPDFMIGLGILDDITVIGFVVNQLSKELDEFKDWKTKRSSPSIALDYEQNIKQ